jgi:hypothetical protein
MQPIKKKKLTAGAATRIAQCYPEGRCSYRQSVGAKQFLGYADNHVGSGR